MFATATPDGGGERRSPMTKYTCEISRMLCGAADVAALAFRLTLNDIPFSPPPTPHSHGLVSAGRASVRNQCHTARWGRHARARRWEDRLSAATRSCDSHRPAPTADRGSQLCHDSGSASSARWALIAVDALSRSADVLRAGLHPVPSFCILEIAITRGRPPSALDGRCGWRGGWHVVPIAPFAAPQPALAHIGRTCWSRQNCRPLVRITSSGAPFADRHHHPMSTSKVRRPVEFAPRARTVARQSPHGPFTGAMPAHNAAAGRMRLWR